MIWSNTLEKFSKLRPTFKRLILKHSDSKSIPIYHMMNGKYAMLVEGKRREAEETDKPFSNGKAKCR